MLRFIVVVVLMVAPIKADVPLPPQVLNPPTAAEAWNVIRLATANVRRLVREQRPIEVTPQISLLGPALRTLSRCNVKPGHELELGPQTTTAFKLVNLIAKESMAENASAIPTLFQQLEVTLANLAKGFEPAEVECEAFHCPTHTDTIFTMADAGGRRCEHCNLKLTARRIPYSFIYARSEQPIVKLIPDSTFPAFWFRLINMEGAPIELSDLWPMHTESVQVLVHGPEYRHVLAQPSGVAGRYSCNLDVGVPGRYRVYVGLTPAATGLPEYPFADFRIEGESMERPNVHQTLRATAGEYALEIAVAGKEGNQLRAGRTQALHLQFKDGNGQPVTQLEPLLQAFAHIDAFYIGQDLLMQLHPAGGDILRDDLRGGPGLSFKIYSPAAGMMDAFVRFKIAGKVHSAHFHLKVEP